jgi:hypothetical protein
MEWIDVKQELHALEIAAEMLRKDVDALLVLVVRIEDVAFAVDPEVAPADAAEMVELVLPAAVQRLKDRLG